MFRHKDLGDSPFLRAKTLMSLIASGAIVLGGNRDLKIYGTLTCRSGKKMKLENRVFFSSTQEAIQKGYRPCAHCLASGYREWKKV